MADILCGDDYLSDDGRVPGDFELSFARRFTTPPRSIPDWHRDSDEGTTCSDASINIYGPSVPQPHRVHAVSTEATKTLDHLAKSKPAEQEGNEGLNQEDANSEKSSPQKRRVLPPRAARRKVAEPSPDHFWKTVVPQRKPRTRRSNAFDLKSVDQCLQRIQRNLISRTSPEASVNQDDHGSTLMDVDPDQSTEPSQNVDQGEQQNNKQGDPHMNSGPSANGGEAGPSAKYEVAVSSRRVLGKEELEAKEVKQSRWLVGTCLCSESAQCRDRGTRSPFSTTTFKYKFEYDAIDSTSHCAHIRFYEIDVALTGHKSQENKLNLINHPAKRFHNIDVDISLEKKGSFKVKFVLKRSQYRVRGAKAKKDRARPFKPLALRIALEDSNSKPWAVSAIIILKHQDGQAIFETLDYQAAEAPWQTSLPLSSIFPSPDYDRIAAKFLAPLVNKHAIRSRTRLTKDKALVALKKLCDKWKGFRDIPYP
jgi:hypothetical protein